MPWYVFGLVDAAPSGAKGRGLSGPLGLRAIPGGFAVVERRADVPPAEFGSLKRHHDVVVDIARRVRAILPVRFGTLLDDDAIDEVLDEREHEIREAFDIVRDRVQYTWRRRKTADAAQKGDAGVAKTGRKASELRALTGAEYLKRAAKVARPVPPAAWRSVRAKLAPLVTAERYQAAGPVVPETLYHLVARDASARYATIGSAIVHADPRLTMTGPVPPFAFAPEML